MNSDLHSPREHPSQRPTSNTFLKQLGVLAGKGLYNLKWVLVISYLMVAMVLIAYLISAVRQSVSVFMEVAGFHTADSIAPAANATEQAERSIVQVLAALDGAMAVNVVYLIIFGSFMVYVVPKLSWIESRDLPPVLQHVSAGLLKEKLAGSLVGVSSVKLIQVMLETDSPSDHTTSLGFHRMAVIHALLLVGMLAINVCNRVFGMGGQNHAAAPPPPPAPVHSPPLPSHDSTPIDIQELGVAHVASGPKAPGVVARAAVYITRNWLFPSALKAHPTFRLSV